VRRTKNIEQRSDAIRILIATTLDLTPRVTPEFAKVARLLNTNNTKLGTVIPSHMRPGAPILAEGKRELERLGIGGLMFVPELKKVYEY